MARKAKSAKTTIGSAGDAQARLLDMLHQVWLAGLGAVSKAQHGAPRVLEDLIAEGARVHTDTRDAAERALRGAFGDVQSALNARMSRVRGEATDAFENLEKIFRARVHRALTQLGVPSADEVAALSRRVDALNASINTLARARRTGPKQRAHAAAH
jgi:poly(hydroxyalkanoate) granule-associated protein